ncbi:MAG: VWA domain-containing protein [Phycisphaerales bacterium]|nr:VWA domain-containing protein [Phycisphaerales bacterium]
MAMTRLQRWLGVLGLISLWTGLSAHPAAAAGLLVPTDQSLPPLSITSHSVRAEIDGLVARTRVTQTFHNDTGSRLEATYLFPIPEGSDITGFSMTFNGKMVRGEVLPADKAQQIYESIVRQARDPGLIEFIGRRLLKMRIFPIEPNSDTTIELTYQQICRPIATESSSADSGLFAYHYPLRTSRTDGRKTALRFTVTLRSDVALKSVWSPTHPVEVVRDSEHDALAAYETSAGSLDEDFLLLFDREDGDMGLSVITYIDPGAGADEGHFLLLLNPKTLWPDETRIPQDVVFVMDTSGSMSGEKIEQARESLRFCLNQLGEGDRFNIVRFSTGFDQLFPVMTERTKESLGDAHKFVDRFSAGGGTNILDALRSAVKLLSASRDADRPMLVVFLTDGNGDRGREPVLAMLDEADTTGIRIFPFGVGHDVNTMLLDALSTEHAGKPTYVQPGENLELVLGDFFSMFSRPVLTNLQLTLPDIAAMEMFPPMLGDLYHGQQIIVAGRLGRETIGSVTLTARRRGEDVRYTWENVAFKSNPSATYVPRLWAGRKIAYLIDTIRQNGETDELVAEVIALSQAYGIQTPYASYLVAPERLAEVAGFGVPSSVPSRRAMDANAIQSAGRQLLRLRKAGIDTMSVSMEAEDMSITSGDDRLDAEEALHAVADETGRGANIVARVQQQLREGKNLDAVAMQQRGMAVQRYGERWYNYADGFLIDQTMTDETELTFIQFGSDAYFELVLARPDLRAALAANRNVVVQITDADAVVVVDGEDEQIQAEFTTAQRARLFAAEQPLDD